MRPRKPSETEIFSQIFLFRKSFSRVPKALFVLLSICLQLVGLIDVYNLCKFWINSTQIKISTNFCIQVIFGFLGSFWNKTVFFSCFDVHFRFVSVHFETKLFLLVFSMYIFGLFWFILKQICLFQLFW